MNVAARQVIPRSLDRSAAVSVAVIDSRAQLQSLASDWNVLLASTRTSEGQLIGIAPLMRICGHVARPCPAQAVEYARTALLMKPGDADTLDTLGWALVHAGRPEEGLVALNEALRLKPARYCIHYHLAKALLSLGQTAAAAEHFELQIQQHPGANEAALLATAVRNLNKALPAQESATARD